MEKYTTRDFDRDFPDDDACLEFLFKSRWPDGVFCEKCQKVTAHYRIKGRPCYSCEHCGSHIYPMAGTIFQDTRFSHLRLWFKAVAYMAVTRCGISSRQLSRDVGVGVKTAWRMFHKIREVLKDDGSMFISPVEVDETYIGGKQPGGKRGRGSENKTVVMGIVERKGRVRARVVPNVKARTLLPIIQSYVPTGSTIYTDDLLSYGRLGQLGYSRKTVAHSQGQYVTGGDIHTNTIEGFWSQLKRSIDGTYHHVTPKYLSLYVDEYSFRYSHRNDVRAMFKTMIEKVVDLAE